MLSDTLMVTKIYVMFVFVFVDFNLGKTKRKRRKPINLLIFLRPVFISYFGRGNVCLMKEI